MTILVTGATGTIGSEVVKNLSKSGTKIRACCHTMSKADKIKGDNVEIVEVDYEKPETIESAFHGAEKLFLLTPVTDKPLEIVEQLIEQAKKSGVKHIVRLSAYKSGEPNIKIFKLHTDGEKLIKQSGIPYTILQPNYFMQNFFMGSQGIKEQNSLFLPYQEAKISLIDARDVGEFAAKILTTEGHEGKTYEITGPESLSMTEAASKLSDALGKEIKYVPVSDDQAREGLKQIGLPEWLLDGLAEFAVGIRKGLLADTRQTFEELMGKKAISFSQFAKDFSGVFK